MKAVTILLSAITLGLAACGGGGSSSMMPTTSAPQVPSADVQNALADSTLAAAARVASSLPAFGSVTQSANRSGVTQVTTDHAITTFDGESFTLKVERLDGSSIHLSTDDDLVEGYRQGSSPISGHDTATRGYIVSTREKTVAWGVVSWDSTDPSDYLAGGYWATVSGDVLGAFEVEAGAFADGPEISMSNRPEMPIQGTASYSGLAEGLFTASQVGAGTTDGIFKADMELTADFGSQTIDGCAGCGSASLDGTPTDYRVRLGATPFESNGVFRGTSVTIEHPNREFVSNSGAWGGMFSNVPDSNGDPRLVAGTLAGQATIADGSKAVFVGAFYATSQ